MTGNVGTFSPSSDSGRHVPGWRQLLLIFLVAIVLRMVSQGAMGLKFDRWADLPHQSDGSAYLANAQRINGEGLPANPYDQRMFVGLPWVIAIAERVIPNYGWTAQGLCWAIAGLMCVAWAQFFRDARIGWALAILPPHFVNDTSAVMNEPLMLLLACAGMAAARSSRGWWMIALSGLAFGAAGMVRPMACFATAGAMAMLVSDRRWTRAAMVGVASAIAFAGLYVLFTKLYWNPLENVRVYHDHPVAYGGEMLTWPLKSAINEARQRGVMNFGVPYKIAYIVASMGIAAYSIVRFRKSRAPLDAMAMTWWIANLAFALCIGSHWGIRIAQRSTGWAIPAALYLLLAWLPTKWYWRLLWALLPAPFIFVTSQG